MPIVNISSTGQIGLNKDLSQHELPPNAWTDAKNIRFLDGYAGQMGGHIEALASPAYVPQHVLACNAGGYRCWIYATAGKVFAAYNNAGTATHVDITHLTPRSGAPNAWTSTLLSGVPVLNAGDTRAPMAWDLNFSHKMVDLTNWPAATSCKSIRAFKNFLVAFNVTKSGTSYPYMVKWSHPADPGSLPSSWDPADATKLAGEVDLADGYDPIVDALPLRDSMLIYKENSIWRMDYIGGVSVFKFSKVLGKSGAMNLNCIGDIDGFHVVLTNDDVILHDGQSCSSILDKQTRRWLFDNIDTGNYSMCFVYVNPYYNEVSICFPTTGATACNTSLVYNYADKTVSVRDLPSVTHAANGPVDSSTTASSWASDSAAWDSDSSIWNNDAYFAQTLRCILASNDQKLYLQDSGTNFNGSPVQTYLERQGLSFSNPEAVKLIRSIRPRIRGTAGQVVNISVGHQVDPFSSPTYETTVQHTIGQTISNDVLVSGRYIAIKFDSTNNNAWRLDSYDVDVVETSGW